MLYAISRTKRRPKNFLTAFEGLVIDKLEEFSPKQLIHLYLAYQVLDHEESDLMTELQAKILEQIKELEGYQLVEFYL